MEYGPYREPPREPAPPAGPAPYVPPRMPPYLAEKAAAAKLRGLGNHSCGLLLLTQILAGAVMFVIILLRTAVLLRGWSGDPLELAQQITPKGNTLILYNYLATFWGMVLCLLIGRNLLRRNIFDCWRRPRTKPSFLAGGVLLMFGAVCVGELLSAALNAVFQKLGISNGTPNFDLKGDPATDAVLIVYVCLLAPVLEETLFRGMILPSLLPWGEKFAVAASSVLFGMFHMNLVQGVSAFFMGLVLGTVAARSGSVLPGIFIHFLNNSLSMAFLAAGIQKSAALQNAYLALLGVCLLGSVALLRLRRKDYSLSDLQQPDAPPTDRRWSAFFLRSAWFWVMAVMFTATCVLLAVSPASDMLQKLS